MDPKHTLEILSRHTDAPEVRRATTAAVHGVSDKGCVRDNNEDQFLIADLERLLHIQACGIANNDGRILKDDPPGHFMLVADGMGGHAGGEVASAVVTDVMVQYAFSMMPWLGPSPDAALVEQALGDGLKRAVTRSEERIREIAERKKLSPTMGSTLTLAYVVWPNLYLVHVGDSRAYLLRREELMRLTKDHNMAEQLVEHGLMTPEQASTTAFSSMLTNAVGGKDTTAEAELHQTTLEEGDILLLCTDGLYGEVEDETIGAALSAIAGPESVASCAQNLVDLAKAAGGQDNITVVLARF